MNPVAFRVRFARFWKALQNARPLEIGIVLLAVLIFCVDALTPQNLVVSLLMDIPIALAGLTLRKKLTFAMILAGLASNVMAGMIDALREGSVDDIAVLNRLFSSLSAVLIGLLTLSIQDKALEIGRIRAEQQHAEQEVRIREFTGALSDTSSSETLLSDLARSLVPFFGASGAIVALSRKSVWIGSRFPSPDSLWFWETGKELPGGLSLGRDRVSTPAWLGSLSVSELREKNNAGKILHSRLEVRSFDPEGEGPVFLHLFILDPRLEGSLSILQQMLSLLEGVLTRQAARSLLEAQNALLSRSNTLLGDLLTGLSHDLRTPVVAATLNLRLALEGSFGTVSPDLFRMLEQSVRTLEGLLELSNGLLLASREDKGLPIRKERILLPILLNEVLESLSPLMLQKKIKVRLDLAPSVVPGDPVAFKRLFGNLIDNAIRWSSPEGTLEILSGAPDPGGLVSVDVRDWGPGIPESMRPELFRRMGRFHPGGGFGLGLYISDRIVRAHGGTLEMIPVDCGTLMRVRLVSVREDP